MIKFEGYSKEERKIFYRNTTKEILPVLVEVYEGYTNSFMFSNEIDLDPRFFYHTYIPVDWKNMRAYFYNRETKELIAPFVFDGSQSLEEIDYEGYLKKIQSKNDLSQQAGVNDVVREHLYDRKYKNIVDVDEGDVVVDVGFNYGVFSLGALQKGASKVYGFEPNIYIFDKLKDYPYKDKVQLFNYAVSDKNEILTFYEGKNTLASSIYSGVDDFKNSYEVKCVNFYDFIKENKIDKINFLKVDCEGTEYEIFDTIPDEFFATIDKIHVEFHNNEGEKIKKLIDKFERNDFKWFLEEGKTLESNIGLIYAKKNKRPQKKVALISSFCDTQEKLDVLEKNVKIIKSHNIDVLLISPFSITKNITDLCDYFFITKDNIVFEWPKKSMTGWRFFIKDDIKYTISTTYPDYGYAGLYQVKQLSEIALNLDYDQFFHMIYDLKIDDNVIEGFYSDKDFSIYPSKREDIIWPMGLHYMIFNRNNLKKFISQINEESYLEIMGGHAFDWLGSQQNILKFDVEKTPVEDEIYYYQEIDFLNFSPTEKIKFFIEKNNETLSNIKLFFYDNIIEKNIKLIVGKVEREYIVNDLDIIDLGFNEDKILTTKIEIEGEIIDLTDIIKKIKHNVITLQ
jgi:FkbM family methyltransferase